MNSSELRPDQAAKLRDQFAAQLRYLGKLRTRMEQLGFSPSDPLYIATSKAYNAMQELHVRAHYLTCTSGVGR